MTMDASFALVLAVRMAVTAGFVLFATVTAERAGPFIGGLVATLPVSAGPTYAFLAMDHSARFIADGALATLTVNGAIAMFLLTYVLLAQRRSLAVSLGGAFLVWLVLIAASLSVAWTFAWAAAWNVAAFTACLILVRPFRRVTVAAVRAPWPALVVRALAVAGLVGLVVGMSARLGPAGSGVLAVFPVVLVSMIAIVHPRLGGPATAALMANAALGLVGFSLAVAVLHVAAVPLGSAAALLLALATSLSWGAALFGLRRAGAPL
jgi:uncharacterized membrane protein (GlpM family)